MYKRKTKDITRMSGELIMRVKATSLKKYVFVSRDLSCAFFTDQDMDGCVFTNCIIKHATFKYSKLIMANFVNCRFENCYFEYLDLSFSKFERCFFEDCAFLYSNLEGSRLSQCMIIRGKFRGCHMKCFTFRDSHFSFVLFLGNKMEGINFVGCAIYGISGLEYASVGFDAHLVYGGTLLAVKLDGKYVFFCWFFRGCEEELREHILNGDDKCKFSRLFALDTLLNILSSSEKMKNQQHNITS